MEEVEVEVEAAASCMAGRTKEVWMERSSWTNIATASQMPPVHHAVWEKEETRNVSKGGGGEGAALVLQPLAHGNEPRRPCLSAVS